MLTESNRSRACTEPLEPRRFLSGHLGSATLIGGEADSGGAAPPPAQGSPFVYPAHATVVGASIGEWTARWWQWAGAIPAAQNPVLDNGPVELNQSGPVFYLPGSGSTAPVTRTQVHVTSGKYLLFPMVNFIDANVPQAPWEGTITEERALLGGVLDTTMDLTATIDGQSVGGNLLTHREVDPFANGFLVNMPEDNPFFPGYGIPAGEYQSISDGYWLMVAPLSNGNHRIHFSSRVTFGDDDASNDFTQDITYQIQVVGKPPAAPPAAQQGVGSATSAMAATSQKLNIDDL